MAGTGPLAGRRLLVTLRPSVAVRPCARVCISENQRLQNTCGNYSVVYFCPFLLIVRAAYPFRGNRDSEQGQHQSKGFEAAPRHVGRITSWSDVEQRKKNSSAMICHLFPLWSFPQYLVGLQVNGLFQVDMTHVTPSICTGWALGDLGVRKLESNAHRAYPHHF